MNCELVIICAVAKNQGIGRKGDLAFHISADLKRFKALTTGHTVVMGRKTFDSLPKGALPNRRNIVITRNPQWLDEAKDNSGKNFEGVVTAPSIEAAITIAEAAGETEVFIIGGGQIYAAAIPLANRLEITEIGADAVDADTYFPEISPEHWVEIDTPDEATPGLQRDEKAAVDYRFVTYRRR